MKKVFHFVSTDILSGLENMVINISTLVIGYKYVYVSPNGIINKYLNKLHIAHISIPNMNPISVRHVIKKYRPNIVQGHDVKASLCLACNASLCHKNGIKIISQIHNDDPRMKKYFGLRSLLYAMSIPAYDNIIMVSKPILDNYVYHNLLKNKVSIITNIINPHRIMHIKSVTRSSKFNKKWDCIFLGRFVYQKDPKRFIRIIKDLKSNKHQGSIRAIMLGTGPLYTESKRYIHHLHLDKNIYLAGFKTNPFKYLNESKVFVMTSRYEGLPLVVLESLMMGIPVVSTHVGGLDDIISNKCGYLVHNNDEFVKDIYTLLKNRKLYLQKSKNSLYRSKQINNVKKFSKSYRKVYES